MAAVSDMGLVNVKVAVMLPACSPCMFLHCMVPGLTA